MATIVKIALDVIVNRTLQTVMVDFALPNMIYRDIRTVKNALHRSALRLLRDPKNVQFHLNTFSSTDFTFLSVQVAKAMPNLIESKLVLMHRDILCERLQLAREKETVIAKMELGDSLGVSFSLTLMHSLFPSPEREEKKRRRGEEERRQREWERRKR